MTTSGPPPVAQLPPTEATSVVVSTYRYLRVALVVLVVGLFISIGLEWATSGTRLPSISAYYFTPVHAVFVGALVTMGVCLIAMKGSTDLEDTVLNFAGMLAPGVAFIPAKRPDPCADCVVFPDPGPAVANNMQTLFVVGALTGVFALMIARRRVMGRSDRIGFAVIAATLAGGVIWFYAARELFLSYAHTASAGLMFAALIAVVWLNARGVQGQWPGPPGPDSARQRYVRIYRTIAIGMLVGLVGAFALQYLVPGVSGMVFWLEVVLIGAFGCFWVVQTIELWDTGLRVEVGDPSSQYSI